MNEAEPFHPPKWPLRLLRFFLKKEYLEEIEGDMEELFYNNVEEHSLQKARRSYFWETLKLLRPVLIEKLGILRHLNQQAMFKNYFKVSMRGLMKNPLNSFINIAGLSAAIGICVFAYAFARWTFSTDQFHEHKNSIYLTTFLADRDGTSQQYGRAPRPLGEMMKEDFAHIKNMCRVEDRNVVIKHGDKVFHERIRYADPSFLTMFTFPLKWGTPGSLTDVNSIILSEDMSIKYFGEENPVGQSILVKFDQRIGKEFKITGVAKEFPKARTISFNFLINFENFRTSQPGYDFDDWKEFVNATFIQVDNPSDLRAIEQGMQKYKIMQNKAVEEDWAITSFVFEPLATLHERSEYIKDDISRSSGDNYKSIVFMAGIAVFMLVLACFNYINIAIATAAKRLKEIGVRKSIGATRRVVIIQFLSENIILTFLALIIGMILGYTLFIPGFEMLWNFSMDFTFNDTRLWMFLLVILLVTSIASGLYPSLYISRFQVVNILKGSVLFGRKNTLTKVFLCFQLVLACTFIVTAVMFTENNSYLEKRPWGYNNRQSLFAAVPDQAGYEKLMGRMLQEPDVLSLSGSSHHVGKSHKASVLHVAEREYEVDQLEVSATYFETMGLKLKQGRTFNDHDGSDSHAVVVNEVLVKNMGWMEPIGQQFRIDSVQYEVVGVLKDFHNYSFSKKVRPIVFTVAAKENYHYLAMHVRSGAELKTLKALQENWTTLFPEIPFEGGLQEDVWGFYYEEIAIYGLVWRVFAFIAMSLAILGLYGLIRFNVEARSKEFSIRKVLGAGLEHISTSIARQYSVLFGLALAAGAPLGFMFGKFLIDMTYSYHMPITLSGTIISVSIMILVVLVTVSTQIVKVLRSNTVNGLKVE